MIDNALARCALMPGSEHRNWVTPQPSLHAMQGEKPAASSTLDPVSVQSPEARVVDRPLTTCTTTNVLHRAVRLEARNKQIAVKDKKLPGPDGDTICAFR